MIRHTFKKEERLTNKKTFDLLFNKGRSIAVPPFRILWIGAKPASSLPVQPLAPTHLYNRAQLGISVPKRSFPKAVDRNKIKRRIRESYRKNKHLLYEILKKKNLHIAMMIIYTAKNELPYQEIEKKMIVSLHKIIEHISC